MFPIIKNSVGYVILEIVQEVELETHLDHRLAMSLYVAGLISQKPIQINEFQWVDISFPEFSDDMLEELNQIVNKIDKGKKIAVTYYDNGEYLIKTGIVTKINFNDRLIFIDSFLIFLDQIIDIILL